MRCPVCGTPDTRVLDSRPIDDGASIKRRRECPACQKRFTTYETVDAVPLSVLKKDGTREIFDVRKLQAGIMHACQKRPVDAAAVAEEIAAELNNAMISEISTRDIGEKVMEKLRALDAVSYVRFASVYREFKDVDTFLDELNNIIRTHKNDKIGGERI